MTFETPNQWLDDDDAAPRYIGAVTGRAQHLSSIQSNVLHHVQYLLGEFEVLTGLKKCPVIYNSNYRSELGPANEPK